MKITADGSGRSQMPSHVEINCAREGCFAIITIHPRDESRLRRTHETFYCPAGHTNFFPGKTAEDKALEDAKREAERYRQHYEDWRDRWEGTHEAMGVLARGAQVCPLGCGWTSRRRLGWGPDESDVDRFLDRVGRDLTEHLVGDHNATRKPVALPTERAGS